MAKDVTVTTDLNTNGSTVRIDNDPLKVTGGSATAKDVEPGQHYLQWFGTAPPGTTYKIAITAPAEAKWESGTRKATPSGALGGSKQFRVNKS